MGLYEDDPGNPRPWRTIASSAACPDCKGISAAGIHACPTCDGALDGPLRLDGWITCYYLNSVGMLHRLVIASSEPIERLNEQQEDIRAELAGMFSQLDCELLSAQIALVGSDEVRRSDERIQHQAEVIVFPAIRRASSMD